MLNNPLASFIRVLILSLVLLSKIQSLLLLPMTFLQRKKVSSSTEHFSTSSAQKRLGILLRHPFVGPRLRYKRSSFRPLIPKSPHSMLLGKGSRGKSMEKTGIPYWPTRHLFRPLSWIMIISLNLNDGLQQRTASSWSTRLERYVTGKMENRMSTRGVLFMV